MLDTVVNHKAQTATEQTKLMDFSWHLLLTHTLNKIHVLTNCAAITKAPGIHVRTEMKFKKTDNDSNRQAVKR